MRDPRPDQLAPWQEQAMAVPEEFDLFLGGGRGGGKTRLLAALFLRHTEQYGNRARCLVVRKSFPGLQDLEAELLAFFTGVFGHRGFSYNRQAHRFELPNGGTIHLDQLERETDFAKFQGRSFTHVAVDEAGQWASPALVDRLRSSLRAPEGVPTRLILLANPGGVGHHWLAQRYALRKPWEPYVDEATATEFVSIASTYRDNPFIDQDKYAANLKASTATDPELGRAWLDGDWSVIRGAFFAGVLSDDRVMVEPWASLPAIDRGPSDLQKHDARLVPDRWQFFLAHDFGVSAPSVTYLCARSPGGEHAGRFWPKDSIILIDEMTTQVGEDLNQGSGATVPEQAADILDMCRYWGVDPSGVADDALFNRTGSQEGTIADEFRRAGVRFTRARKGSRAHGWEKMRRLLADAGSPDRPGLYVTRRCTYWWATVPTLPRDPRRPEDLDTTAPDHGADASRYALTDASAPVAIPVKWAY